MQSALVLAPSIAPVTYQEVEAHLRLDEDVSAADLALVNTVIDAARSHVEDYTRRALLTQTWDYFLPGWPDKSYIVLPFGNLQSVTSVKYTDSDGDQTTMAVTTEYLVETNGTGYGRIVLPYGVSWPSFTKYPSNPIAIRFICGWTAASAVPSTIKIALKMLCADFYSNREYHFVSRGESLFKNAMVEHILDPYRLPGEF